MTSLSSWFGVDDPTPFLVLILTIIFLGWFVYLIYAFIALGRRWFEIKQLSEVEALAKDVHTGLLSAEVTPGPGKPDAIAKSRSLFRQYIATLRIDKDGPVVEHVGAIFVSGRCETRLDVPELLAFTAGRIGLPVSVLRSLLSTFIVVGLLGTLVGLGRVLGQLTPNLIGSLMRMSETGGGSAELANLLGQLRSVFIPSLFGVFYSILGVFALTMYQAVFANVRTALERATLTIWIPQLIPTTSARLLETLRKSEEAMRENIRAAAKVAEFASDIESEASELRQNLEAANPVLKRLGQASDRLAQFSIRFTEGAEKLVSFQEELRTLYETLLSESEAFRESVRAQIAVSEEFYKQSRQTTVQQNSRLRELLESLKTYESVYLADSQQLRIGLGQLLEAARKAFTELDERNRDLVDLIGTPLQDTLTWQLGELDRALIKGLNDTVSALALLDTPLKGAASIIEGTFSTADRSVRQIVDTIRDEIKVQASTIKELSEKIIALEEQRLAAMEAKEENSSALDQQASALLEALIGLRDASTSLERIERARLETDVRQQPPSQADRAIITLLQDIKQFSQAQHEQLLNLGRQQAPVGPREDGVRALNLDRNKTTTSVAAPGDRPPKDEPLSGEVTNPGVSRQRESIANQSGVERGDGGSTIPKPTVGAPNFAAPVRPPREPSPFPPAPERNPPRKNLFSRIIEKLSPNKPRR